MTRSVSNGKKISPAENQKTAPKLSPLFTGLFGALLGLSLLKFGNPILMEQQVDRPTNVWEWLLNPWPVVIGYWLLAGVVVVGLALARWQGAVPRVLVVLPLVWLGWEVLAATQSAYPELSWPTVGHFLTCVVCFYLGLFCLSRVERLGPFWLGLLAGFFIVLALGFQQHFGGLKDTQQYWLQYVYPTAKDVPFDFYKKMKSSRIFSTLFYPNTLGGVILMLLPVALAFFWSCRARFTVGARRFLMGITAVAALGCLYWSGSKAGWLLMLVLGFVATLHLPIQRQIKLALIAAVLVLGLVGFFVKYAGFFKKGATSVTARFDYWEAALKTTRAHPTFGTGPGTFAKAYQRVKRPESEMARLTHNDYLEQASDSGLPGCLAYSVWVIGSLVYAWRKGGLANDWVKLAVWLGLLGWVLQSFVEFGLYIPAISWPAFALLGWSLGQCDKSGTGRSNEKVFGR